MQLVSPYFYNILIIITNHQENFNFFARFKKNRTSQQSWIRALDNKFSLLKAQKIYYKALKIALRFNKFNYLTNGFNFI